MDVTYLALRQGSQGKEGALGVYGILENGKRVLLRLALGNQEPCKAWLSFLMSCRQGIRVWAQELAGAAGLEPATGGFGDRCST